MVTLEDTATEHQGKIKNGEKCNYLIVLFLYEIFFNNVVAAYVPRHSEDIRNDRCYNHRPIIGVHIGVFRYFCAPTTKENAYD